MKVRNYFKYQMQVIPLLLPVGRGDARHWCGLGRAAVS